MKDSLGRHHLAHRLKGCSASSGAGSSTIAPAPPAITLTEAALKNLKRLRDDAGDETLLLRMGVKSGGCSGETGRGASSSEDELAGSFNCLLWITCAAYLPFEV